jgi:hypothetical protein
MKVFWWSSVANGEKRNNCNPEIPNQVLEITGIRRYLQKKAKRYKTWKYVTRNKTILPSKASRRQQRR